MSAENVEESTPKTEELKGNKGASRLYIVTKKMPAADTECKLILRKVKGFRIKCRDGTAFRFAFEQGKVGTATPAEPYYTILANGSVSVRNIDVEELYVYVACGSTGKVVELIVQGD